MKEGSTKISSHWWTSPFRTFEQSCGTCHKESQEEMGQRVLLTQDRVKEALDRAGEANKAAMSSLVAAFSMFVALLHRSAAHSVQKEQNLSALLIVIFCDKRSAPGGDSMKGLLAIPVALLLLLPATALYLNKALGGPEPVAVSTPAPDSGIAGPVVEGDPAPPAEPPVAEPPTAEPPVVTPMEPVPSSPESSWERAPALAAAVGEAMTDFPGEYSVIVQEVESGQRWAYNPERRYHPASTIKMPVTLYTLEQYRAGRLGWNDLIEYTQADFESPGGGAFETADFGGLYPVENLVRRALRYSNNVAVNMLGRHHGWDNIRAWARTIGGDLYRLDDGSPRVTALSELGWWIHLDKLAREDPTRAELLLQPLREVEYKGRISAGLPSGVEHLHKFGSYDSHYHDTGIIYTERPYILIVLTHGASVDVADAAIARVSAAVYGVLNAPAE